MQQLVDSLIRKTLSGNFFTRPELIPHSKYAIYCYYNLLNFDPVYTPFSR